MKIHLSTATISSYENRNKSMSLIFHPVVMFENSWPFPLDHLKDMRWSVEAEQIGSRSFEITVSVDSPFDIENDRNYIEFHLVTKCVKFQYGEYPCRILFGAKLDCPHASLIKIKE